MKHRFFGILITLQVVFMLSALCLLHRSVSFSGHVFSFSALIFPFTFMLTNIAAAVYGYQASRQVMWLGLLAQLPFALIFNAAHILPLPPHVSYEASYCLIFQGMWQLSSATLLGALCAQSANLSIFTKSRHYFPNIALFWHIAFASGVGELLFTLVAVPLMMTGYAPHKVVLSTIIVSCCVKLALSTLLSAPSTWLINFLKKLENPNEIEKYHFFSYHPLDIPIK